MGTTKANLGTAFTFQNPIIKLIRRTLLEHEPNTLLSHSRRKGDMHQKLTLRGCEVKVN
jgi:hypothetical protein